MTVKIQSLELEASGNLHQTPEQWLASLDPEWVQIWNAYGGRHRQAEQVPIEEVRRKPAAYSFTYPTWSGKHYTVPCMIFFSKSEQVLQFSRRKRLRFP
jgi:hypothetical protein